MAGGRLRGGEGQGRGCKRLEGPDDVTSESTLRNMEVSPGRAVSTKTSAFVSYLV